MGKVVCKMARKYTKEFKTQACEIVVKDCIKHHIVAEKLGINVGVLYRWIDEYQMYGEDAFVGSGKQRPADAGLKKIQRENEYLRQEIEILKKAAAYCARLKGQD